MLDPRVSVLAGNLVNYSCEVRPGDKVLIEAVGLELPLVTELIKEVYRCEAIPFLTIKNSSVERSLLLGAKEQQMILRAKYESARMADMDAYIGVRSGDNASELSDVPPDGFVPEAFMGGSPWQNQGSQDQVGGFEVSLSVHCTVGQYEYRGL